MRALIVARYKQKGFAPFVTEQVEALKGLGIECRFFPVKSRGVAGYIKHLPALRRAIKEFQPDFVHAHYGLCGLLANLQRKVPVVTTYHGSDINNPKVRPLSKMAIGLSRWNIFVSRKSMDLMGPQDRYALIPCGINLADFPLMDKAEARRQMNLAPDAKYVLFAGAFDNPVKNASLAKETVTQLPGVELLELKGYTRSQVAVLLQAVDSLLMTSHFEGSPQIIKEALACGCPIVSVDVGDVRERIGSVKGCFISISRDPEELAELLKKTLSFEGRTSGRGTIREGQLENDQVAKRLMEVYASL